MKIVNQISITVLFFISSLVVKAQPGINNGPQGYTKCADENGSYTFDNTVDIAYGANGKYVYRKGVKGVINFNNTSFGGDPVPGVVKHGFFKNIMQDPSSGNGPEGYTKIADENGVYTFGNTVDVAYGVNGKFAYKMGITGTISFNNSTFGDPVPGVGKYGYFRNSANNNNNVGNVAINNPSNNSLNIQAMLDAQNAYRKELGLPSLTWSNELAQYAQKWVNELAKNRNCIPEHRPRDENDPWNNRVYGENWWMGKGHPLLDAVSYWGKEKKFFDTRTKAWGNNCLHYSQLIWKLTTKVGCAVATCSDGSLILVCNYDPPGNVVGQPPY